MGVTEHTQDATVYTDPSTPGAPQVGDVVVVVWDGEPHVTRQGRRGIVTKIRGCHRTGPWRWWVPGGPDVHAVRRPTEAELATWAIQEGAHE